MTRALASLELWCSLARDVVTVTHVPGAPWTAPDGWKGWLFPRNDRVNWLVLERECTCLHSDTKVVVRRSCPVHGLKDA